jgi:CRP/FNR family transcriptional regulator, cyclic AMP receptor protein
VRLGLRHNAKIDLISKVPLFAGLSKKQLGEIARIADELDLPAGKVLIREGERGREFFVLLEGDAEVRRKGRKLGTSHGGDFFGEIALVSDRPRTATVTATTPLRVLVVTDRAFRELLHDMPQIAVKVLSALAERVPTTDL